MQMTLDQYILNPMGKNNAVLNAHTRENMRKEFTHKFDNLLLREHGAIKYDIFFDKTNNVYWFYAKIPSELVRNFYYDVVFKFTATESTPLLGEDLFKRNVQFYSNDPAFVYTYAHVFVKNDLFIPQLLPKMSKKAVKEAADIKNPLGVVGYVKTIYFAYLLMKRNNLNKVSKIEKIAKPFDLAYLLHNIMDAEEKVALRQSEKVSTKKKIDVDKTTLRNIRKNTSPDADLSGLQIRTSKRVNKISNKSEEESSIKSSKKIGSGSIRSTKSIKKTKRK